MRLVGTARERPTAVEPVERAPDPAHANRTSHFEQDAERWDGLG
jgi:hypothetical protein